MAKNFTALQAKMPPEARRRAEAKAEATLRSEFRGHHTYLPPSAMATSADAWQALVDYIRLCGEATLAAKPLSKDDVNGDDLGTA